MKSLSRRSVLKTGLRLTTLGALSALSSSILGCDDDSSDSSERDIILNVVCHGLFALNVTDIGLELFTPDLDDGSHLYKAGSWDKNLVHDLKRHYSYRLLGVQNRSLCPKTNRPLFDLSFSQDDYKFSIYPEYSHHVVYLPFPEKISLLRVIDTGKKNTVVNGVATINRLSLCQVFSYFVPDYKKLKLLEVSNTHHSGVFEWEPRIEAETGTANLHFWAEPPVRLPPIHADHAYSKLHQLMFPLSFQLGTYDTAPLDKETGVLGVSPEEEQGWSEWVNGGEGSYPTNCSLVRSFQGTNGT